MRFAVATVLSVLAASGAVCASEMLEARQSPFPPCATACMSNANLGGCAAADTACTCKNTEFVNSVTQCIFANCQGSDLTKAISTAQALCRAVGVTLTSTPVPTASGSTASATGNSSATSVTKSGSSTGTATGAYATKTNAAYSKGNSLTLVGASSALGLVALSLSLM